MSLIDIRMADAMDVDLTLYAGGSCVFLSLTERHVLCLVPWP
jgi:hypothetical protein